MNGMKTRTDRCSGRALPADEKLVELEVEGGQDSQPSDGRPWPAPQESERRHDGSGGAHTVTPAEVEGCRARSMAQHELHPRDAAPGEVRTHHVGNRPALEVGALEERVEYDL